MYKVEAIVDKKIDKKTSTSLYTQKNLIILLNGKDMMYQLILGNLFNILLNIVKN